MIVLKIKYLLLKNSFKKTQLENVFEKENRIFPLTLLLSPFWPSFPAPPPLSLLPGPWPSRPPPFPPSLFLSPTSEARLSAPSLPNRPRPLPFLCRSGTASSFPRSHDLPMPRASDVLKSPRASRLPPSPSHFFRASASALARREPPPEPSVGCESPRRFEPFPPFSSHW